MDESPRKRRSTALARPTPMSVEPSIVELNRNHYFMAGLLALLLGFQLRMVDAYVLNEHVTRFLATRLTSQQSSERAMTQLLVGPAAPKKTLRPPDWLGWALMSAGSVLVLHSLALKSPGSK
jgi:hypothetical protein